MNLKSLLAIQLNVIGTTHEGNLVSLPDSVTFAAHAEESTTGSAPALTATTRMSTSARLPGAALISPSRRRYRPAEAAPHNAGLESHGQPVEGGLATCGVDTQPSTAYWPR